MSLVKRGGSVWHYDFTVKGRRYRGSTDQTNRYLADLVENDKKKEAREGKLLALLGKTPTLDAFSREFIEWVEATHALDQDTRCYYKNGWRLLRVTTLARMKLDQISNHDCEMLKFPGGPASANTALAQTGDLYVTVVVESTGCPLVQRQDS